MKRKWEKKICSKKIKLAWFMLGRNKLPVNKMLHQELQLKPIRGTVDCYK